MEKIRIISFTKTGFELSKRMAEVLKVEYEVWQYTTKDEVADQEADAIHVTGGLNAWCEECFYDSSALIFIGACGIAVRTIAPFIQSKVKDPAVLVSDEHGKNMISLLSGHLGGGNALTDYLARALDATPIITTASDVNGRIAIDVWAKKNNLVITDLTLAKKVAANIVAGQRIPFFCGGDIKGVVPGELEQIERKPGQFCITEQGEMVRKSDYEADRRAQFVVSVYDNWKPEILRLVPKTVILGIGCMRGKTCAEVRAHVERMLEQKHIARESICQIVSIDLKENEGGIIEYAKELSVPYQTFSREELQEVPGMYSPSDFVQNTTGVGNVCERAAVAALPKEEQEKARFICRKTAADGVTAALVCREWSVSFE
jgi:cobalt-precorrin 5A hydrolase